MNDHIKSIVLHTVAQHVGVHVTAIAPHDHFREDLGFLPLDCVMIALRIEEIENMLLPIEQLDAIATVGQLIAWVRRIHANARREHSVLALFWRRRFPRGRGRSRARGRRAA